MTLYTEDELRRLLEQDEGQYLELKSVWDRSGAAPKLLPRKTVRDTIAEAVAAFANADGGTLILGVEDDGVPTGHSYPEEAIVDFLAVPERRLRPAVRVATQRARLGAVELLLLNVHNHPEAVMVEGNGFPCRVGDQVIREPQEAINERKADYRRVGYERQTRPEATLDDLDLGLVPQLLGRSPLAGRPVSEILVAYGLIVPRGDGFAISNAALLLFGRPPLLRWHPRAGARVFRVRGTERRVGRDRNVEQLARIDPPLASAIPAARAAIVAQIRRSEVLHNLFFREMPEYPEFAWQEGLVNAFAHRDYAEQGREIEVWLFDDRMEVSSPGVLVPPVSLADLRGRNRVHASRNPLIARVLVDAGIMREEGEGVPRIHEEMEQSFLKPPEFEVSAATFTLTLRNTPIFEGPSDAWQAIVADLNLRATQKRVLLAHPEGFTNEDYRALTGLDRDHAYREISEMVAAGVLRSPGRTGPGARYRLSPDLHDSARWLERRLPRLRVALTNLGGKLANADYRQLFSVTRLAAVRELRRLVDEGFLLLVGEKRGSHYVPGPKLPREVM
jgi:ATP-dependent DNA helicase RecG